MPDAEPLADWPAEEREELIDLGELASLAVWVEPGLLRQLRLNLLPGTDADPRDTSSMAMQCSR